MYEERKGRDVLRVGRKGCIKRRREGMCEERREGMHKEREGRNV
jgi:hypothetical protein